MFILKFFQRSNINTVQDFGLLQRKVIFITKKNFFTNFYLIITNYNIKNDFAQKEKERNNICVNDQGKRIIQKQFEREDTNINEDPART